MPGKRLLHECRHAKDEPAPDDSCPGSHKDLALALHQRSLPAPPPHRIVLQSSSELHIVLQYSVIPAGNMLYLGTGQGAWGMAGLRDCFWGYLPTGTVLRRTYLEYGMHSKEGRKEQQETAQQEHQSAGTQISKSLSSTIAFTCRHNCHWVQRSCMMCIAVRWRACGEPLHSPRDIQNFVGMI